MTKPQVSIIIPVYNAERYIRECLSTVCSQTLADIEIICVDDGSTDGSVDILRAYAKADSRFKVIHQANQGILIARKIGIQQSTGQYIQFIDPDDRLVSNRSLEAAVGLMYGCKADISQFSIQVFGEDSESLQALQELLTAKELRIEGALAIIRRVIEGEITWHLWNKIFNGNLCRQAIKNTESIRMYTGADAYQFLVIASYAKTYYSQKTEPLYAYRSGHGITTRRAITLDNYRDFVAEVRIVQLLRGLLNSRYPSSEFQRQNRQLLAELQNKFLEHCLRRFVQLSPSDREGGYRMLVEAFGEDSVQEKAHTRNKVACWRYRILSALALKKKREHYKYKVQLLEALRECQALEGWSSSKNTPDSVNNHSCRRER